MKKPKIGISIFGQGHLAINLIRFVNNSKKFNLKNIICNKNESIFDKSLEDWCRYKKIKFSKSFNSLKSGKRDIGISILYDKKIPKRIIKKFGLIFNCHYSVLPKFRGINPVHWAIKNKDEIGLTLHKIEPTIDTGKILKQFKTKKTFNNAFSATSFLNQKAFVMIKNFLDRGIKKKEYFSLSQTEVSKNKNYFGKKDKFKLGKHIAFFQKKSRYNFYDGTNSKISTLIISNEDENKNFKLPKNGKVFKLKIGKKKNFFNDNLKVVSKKNYKELVFIAEKLLRNNVYFDITHVHTKVNKKLASLIKRLSKKIVYTTSYD